MPHRITSNRLLKMRKLLPIAVATLLVGCTDSGQPQNLHGSSAVSDDSARADTGESTGSNDLNGLWKSRSDEFFVELREMSGEKGSGINYNRLERSCYDRADVEYQRLSANEFRATYSGGIAEHSYTERIELEANGDTLIWNSYDDGQQQVLNRSNRSPDSLKPTCGASSS